MADPLELLRELDQFEAARKSSPDPATLLRELDEFEGAKGPAPNLPRADDPWIESTTPERFGDTIGEMTEGPRNALSGFAKGIFDYENSPTANALPTNMNPTLRRTLAQTGDVAMTGVTALGTGFAAGAGLVGEVIGGNRTNERALARDLMMMGQVAVPELAGVSSTMRMAGAAGKAPVKPVTPSQDKARAAGDLGITPSLGMNGKLPGMAAAAVEKIPFAGSKIARDAARAVGEIETAFYRATSEIGTPGTPERIGGVMQDSAKRYVQAFKDRSEKLYGEVGKHIPANTRVPISNAAAAIDEVKAVFEGNPELAKKLGVTAWDGILAEAQESGGLQWAALTRFRSQVGAAIGRNKGEIGDNAHGDLSQLYGALTADMEAGAQAAGKPALDAWKRANSHYSKGSEAISKLLDQNASPERAYEAFVAMAKKDRSTADARRMRIIRASMNKEEWGDVSASIVDRLGKSRPGQQNAEGDSFSPATFLTEWNKLSSEAKNILLPRATRVELEKLAKVADLVRDAGGERNMSNTGTVVVGAGLGASATQAPLTTALAVGGTWLSASAMTNQTFLRALNRFNQGHPKAIEAMARGKGPFAKDAATLLQLTAANSASTPGTGQVSYGQPR